MVDIVRWLRTVAEDWRCEEAADEIERLRARETRLREALEKIADDGNATGCNPQIMCNTARAALGGEKKP